MIDISPELVTLLMFLGLMIGLFLGHPVAFVLGGVAAIIGVLGWGPEGLYLFMGRSFDSITNQILIAIPLFVLMAVFLDRSGIAEGLFKSMMYLFGRMNGGVALAVTILSVIFAATTGVIGASVVSMSLMSIPIMMKRQYDKHLATGVVAAGGTLGILIPPSIMLVMMADQSGISVGKLFAGAFLPGTVLGLLYFIYVLVVTMIDPKKGPALTSEERAAVSSGQMVRMLLVSLIPPLILIIGVLGSIWLGVATPTEASGMGAFLALILMIVYGKFNWQTLKDCLRAALRTNAMVMGTIVGATLFTGVFLGLGGGDVVTNLVMSFESLGKWGIFFIMMFIVFGLGFLIDWIGIVYITFPIFLPIAAQVGFDPIWFIMMMAVNLQMSFLTPPFGYALFYLKGTVPPNISLQDIYRGIIPFVLIQLIGLIVCAAFPQLTTFLPSLIKN